MVLKDAERAQLLEALREVKPYIVEVQQIEKIIEETLASADSLNDFVNKMQEEHNGTKDSVLRTDLRIYIGRLRKKAGIQDPTA